jgi:hypothetical protein
MSICSCYAYHFFHCKVVNDFCFIRFQGLGTGIKLVAVAAAGVYGLQQSMFTVDGGHREDINYECKGETYSTCLV